MSRRSTADMAICQTQEPITCCVCIRGMRIRVKDVLDLLAADVSEKEILEDILI
jgi:uncharacterized protein (DUF433 family)